MTLQTVQQFIDSGDAYFWFCKKCDQSRKLDMVRFRDKFGPDHGASAADIVPRLCCTRCKSPDIGLMWQAKGSRGLPEVVPIGPAETIEYAGPRARWTPDLYSSGSCVYRLDAKGEIFDIVAWAKSALVARKALEALRQQSPDETYQQRRRGWVESD